MKISCPLSRSLLIVFALACTALLPAKAFGVSPPPIGGYPGENTATGDFALLRLSSGRDNTAIGFDALLTNSAGSFNTATGAGALLDKTTGNFNTATGFQALVSNISGIRNTASGYQALYGNTSGGNNTANGYQALFSNTTGSFNTADGYYALYTNTTGFDNTANGSYALSNNTTGNNNTANGSSALLNNTLGVQNTANGALALASNIAGNNNTATGVNTLSHNTTGVQNTATGVKALISNTAGNFNTANGVNTLSHNTTGSNNTALGNGAGLNLTTGSNNIVIGNAGVAAQANTIRVGTQGTQSATYIAGIRGATVPGGISVFVGVNGHLGTATSSERFKTAIQPMEKTSEAIFELKPVTFRYKDEYDPDGIPQFGLVAEEVEKVNPDLVARDADGKVYTVRYEVVNAMLRNEFLKEHKTVQELEAKVQKQETIIAQQQDGFQFKLAQQQKQIEALASGLQKVSARFEISKPAANLVVNQP